jgi:hypothetical protein
MGLRVRQSIVLTVALIGFLVPTASADFGGRHVSGDGLGGPWCCGTKGSLETPAEDQTVLGGWNYVAHWTDFAGSSFALWIGFGIGTNGTSSCDYATTKYFIETRSSSGTISCALVTPGTAGHCADHHYRISEDSSGNWARYWDDAPEGAVYNTSLTTSVDTQAILGERTGASGKAGGNILSSYRWSVKRSDGTWHDVSAGTLDSGGWSVGTISAAGSWFVRAGSTNIAC